MKNLIKSKPLSAAIALAGLIALAPAAHAQSIDVSVIGTITPAACVPAIAGGGVIDYGNIPASTLNVTAFNVLAAKTVAFTITCDAATRVGLTAVDNASSSQVAGILSAINPAYTEAQNYGLGTVSGANVGGYGLSLLNGTFTIDGTAHENMNSADGGTTWVMRSSAVRHDGRIVSWGDSVAAGPVAGQNFAGTMQVQAVLNKASELPLTADVPLAGSATMTLVYL